MVRRTGLNFPYVDGNDAAWTPLERLEGAITPNGLHFVRNHNGTPEIDPARHRLLVHGLVEQPLNFDTESLQRYPLRSQQIFLECGGNSSQGWAEEPVQRPASLVHGLLSCTEWTGVPLGLLLDEAGIDPRATWVIATSADAGALQMSLPLAKARDDCLVALAVSTALAALVLPVGTWGAEAAPRLGLPITAAAAARTDPTVFADGRGLPPGQVARRPRGLCAHGLPVGAQRPGGAGRGAERQHAGHRSNAQP